MNDEVHVLSDAERQVLEEFHTKLAIEWDTLAKELGCDVDTAKKMSVQYEHERM